MQLSLFTAAPLGTLQPARAPARPHTAMLLAMSSDHAPASAPAAFAKQASPEQATQLLGGLNAMRDAGFCLGRIAGWDGAKRAIEIAITGDHPLGIENADFGLLAAAWNLRGNADGAALILAADDARLPAPAMFAAAEPAPGYDEAETSAAMLVRITATRARMADDTVPLQCDAPAAKLLKQALQARPEWIPARALIVAVARTIAHMAGCHWIGRIHLAEALYYLVPPASAAA